MYERIVVPLDGSELAERALSQAQELASVANAPLHLVRVIDITHLGRYGGYGLAVEAGAMVQVMEDEKVVAQQYMQQMKQKLSERGLTVTAEMRSGPAAAAILEATQPGDVIVMATHGRGGMARWFLGSVAEDVVRRSAVPVLLVRALTPKPPTPNEDQTAG